MPTVTLAARLSVWPTSRVPRLHVTPPPDGQLVNAGEPMPVAGGTMMVTVVSSLGAWVVQTVIEYAAVPPGCTCGPPSGWTWMHRSGAVGLGDGEGLTELPGLVLDDGLALGEGVLAAAFLPDNGLTRLSVDAETAAHDTEAAV